MKERIFKNKSATALATSALLMAGSTNAATVGLVDTIFATDDAESLLYTVDGSGLDVTGASVIVVTLATEGNSGNQSNPNPIESLTYGGVGFSLAAQSGNSESSIYYLDTAGISFVGTDFVLDFQDGPQTGIRGFGFAAISLSNTADGGPSFTTETGGAIASIEPPTAGGALVSSYARNNNFSPGTEVTPGLVEVYDAGIGPLGLPGHTGAAYYLLNLAAGPQDIQIDGMNGSGRTVHATFDAVPEPSSLALLGLGGLLIARRRRR